MKRFSLVVLVLCFMVPGVAQALDFPSWGEPGTSKEVYIDNTARTMQSLYERAGGTWARTDSAGISSPPIGMLLVCKSLATNWAWDGTTPTTSVGVPFPAASSWFLPGSGWMSKAKAIAGGATDNVACHMVPAYYP